MNCPFYGRSLSRGADAPGIGFVALAPSGGNQCALITAAHSPCWMEIAERRAPEWAACPRNPEWITETFRSGAELARWNAHAVYLDALRTGSAIARFMAGFKPPPEPENGA